MHKRTPWQANAAMTMFRRILFFAVALGIIPTNPASKMEMSGNTPRQQKWEDDDLEKFLPVAKAQRRSIWLATILGAELGQRKADILNLRREDLVVRGFHVQQKKGGVVVEVPCSKRLRKALAEIPSEPGFLVVSETTGRPYQEHNFSHVFAEMRADAGITGLRYQILRRTCVVNLGASRLLAGGGSPRSRATRSTPCSTLLERIAAGQRDAGERHCKARSLAQRGGKRAPPAATRQGGTERGRRGRPSRRGPIKPEIVRERRWNRRLNGV